LINIEKNKEIIDYKYEYYLSFSSAKRPINLVITSAAITAAINVITV